MDKEKKDTEHARRRQLEKNTVETISRANGIIRGIMTEQHIQNHLAEVGPLDLIIIVDGSKSFSMGCTLKTEEMKAILMHAATVEPYIKNDVPLRDSLDNHTREGETEH